MKLPLHRRVWLLLHRAGYDWINDRGATHGAAVAFYSLLSIAPLVVIGVAITAFFLDEEQAREGLLSLLDTNIGREGSLAVLSLLENAQRLQFGTTAGFLGAATLLFGASGVFAQLQDSINLIWKVPPKKTKTWGMWDLVKSRLFSFAMVLGVGFLLLVSLGLSALVNHASLFTQNYADVPVVWKIVNSVISVGINTLLFAMIFRTLPDTRVDWRDVWFGSIVTAILFTFGKILIGLYLSKSGLASAYGAAGSLVVLVVWVYYSAQILIFGVELTHVYALSHGSKQRRSLTESSTDDVEFPPS